MVNREEETNGMPLSIKLIVSNLWRVLEYIFVIYQEFMICFPFIS
jgi:hypothetical protein